MKNLKNWWTFSWLALSNGLYGYRKPTLPVFNLEIIKNIDHNTTLNKLNAQPIITIWIHGTRLIPRFSDNCGLFQFNQLSPYCQSAKNGKVLNTRDASNFPSQTFYAYYWSGTLNIQKRKNAAQDLANQLTHLINEYIKRYNKKPLLRIIAHSHGGNVALYLAKYLKTISIDDLILLATPVQVYTQEYINSEKFKNIYSIYSAGDSIQVLDPQGIYGKKKDIKKPLFSQRLFSPHSKLKQIQLKINGRNVFHIEFEKPSFMKVLPDILSSLSQISLEHYILNVRRK